MHKYYSRLDNVEERRNLRRAILFIFLSVAIFLLLAFFIVPLITNVTGLFSKTGKQNPISESINAPPAPPLFDSIPEATNKSSLEVLGSVVVGNTVVINYNGSEYEISPKDDGIFATTLDLVKGNNTLFAYTKGPTGKLSQKSSVYTIYYDNEPPKIEISSPSDGSSYYGSKQQNVEIKGVTEPDSKLTVNDRIILVEDDGSFSYNYFLNEGENNLTFKAIDKAGNEKETSLKLNYSP